MELCRFFAALEGFRRANSSEDDDVPAPTEEDYRALLEQAGQ